MSKFAKKRGKSNPAISTASLPDIIFMLLFFFMVVTVLRDQTLLIKVDTPEATELTKIEDKKLVTYIHVGRPTAQNQALYGQSPRIQLNDRIIENNVMPLEIAKYLAEERSELPESQQQLLITALKVDGDVTLGIVEDIKEQLRKNNTYRLVYSTDRKRTQ